MPRLHMGDVDEHIFAPLIHDYLPVTFTQQLSYLDEKGTTPKCNMIAYNNDPFQLCYSCSKSSISVIHFLVYTFRF